MELFVGSGWSQMTPSTRTIRALDAVTGRRRWEYTTPPGGDYNGGLLQLERKLLGHLEGSVSHWILTADTNFGAFHLVRVPGPPRSRSLSTDNRWFS